MTLLVLLAISIVVATAVYLSLFRVVPGIGVLSADDAMSYGVSLMHTEKFFDYT